MLCGLTAVVSDKLNELLLAMVDELVDLEEEVGLVSKQCSCHIFVLVCVEYVILRHHR